MAPSKQASPAIAPGFLADVERELGRDGVGWDHDFLARYGRDVSGCQRAIAAVLFPAATAQVVACVEAARRYRVPLYPVSTGMNWGLGSALPVRDGAVVVDLRRMNRIRHVDVGRGYAVVEPGVSQRLLADRLRADGAAWFLNVTGAPTGHSIIGNALERGVGMYGGQPDLVHVTQVVLGSGAVLTTGLPATAKAAAFYPAGVGPDLAGLFLQSNFGIVTEARVRLLPRQPVLAHVFCSIHDRASLPRAVQALATLHRAGVVGGGLHFANPGRSQLTLRPALLDALRRHGWTDDTQSAAVADELLAANRSAWSVATTLGGSATGVRDAARRLRRALHGAATTRVLSEARIALLRRICRRLGFLPMFRKQSALLSALEPLLGLSAGVPSDSPLDCTFPDRPTDPGDSKRGLRFCLPIVPLDGGAMQEVEATASRSFAEHGFALSLTFNTVSPDAVEGVLTLLFDRSSAEETVRAQACIDHVMQALHCLGYPPYRLGIDTMPFLTNSTYCNWNVIASLKHVLDPDEIIAPGRYNRI